MFNQSIVFKDNQMTATLPHSSHSNKVSTTLYNRYNFIPLGLWYQVTQVINLWFIGICILCFIPLFATVNPISNVLPVVVVIGFSLFLDYFEDYKRYKLDQEQNRKIVRVLREGQYKEIYCQDLRVGDVQILSENERTGADVIVLAFESFFEFSFIDTKTLDGEKALKPKISLFPRIDPGDPFDLQLEDFKINYSVNTRILNHFTGRTFINGDPIQLNVTNFIPQTAQIKNTYQLYGLVIYIGKDTKTSLNQQKRIFKKSSMEQNLQIYILWVLLLLVLILGILCFIAIIYEKRDKIDILYDDRRSDFKVFLVTVAGYLILLNQFLPISLVITLHLLNLFQKVEFNNNINFFDKKKTLKSKYNSINLSQELGQIQYILSDKTGTLTQNIMICRNFQIGNKSLEINLEDKWFKETEDDFFKPFKLISQDMNESLAINSQSELERLFFILLCTCHTCFAMYEENSTQQSYQGPSSDEVSILNGIKEVCRYFLQDTNQQSIIIKDKKTNQNIIVKKLFQFDFDSDRKMMSIIVELEGKYLFFSKGADSSIIERSTNELSDMFKDSVQNFYFMGFRIMFMAMKILSKQEVDKILKDIIEKEQTATPKDLYNYKMTLEKNLYIVGCSVVEDKLQDDLKDTLQAFKKAKIKVWVITGDKRDTAINIAFQAGLIENTNPVFFEGQLAERIIKKKIKLQSSFKENYQKKQDLLQRTLQKTNQLAQNSLGPFMQDLDSKNQNLIVNSRILDDVLSDKYSKYRFFQFITNFECVIFCRANPTQKVQIVRILKSHDICVLAVGDGQNDVNMIQEANVGIGIIGNEGNQAKNASDMAISQFSMLKPLLFDFGRGVYQRNSILILFFFYKNILFVMPQFYFAFFSLYTAQNFYGDWYLSLYNTIFTAFLIPGMVVSNRDFDKKAPYYVPSMLQNVYTYFYGQQNYYFSWIKFALWFIFPMLESFYIFIFNYFFFKTKNYSFNHEFTWAINFLIFLSAIFYHQTFKTFYFTFKFNFFYFLGLFLNFLSFYVFIVISDNYNFGVLNGLSYTYNVQNFYLVTVFHIGSLLFFTHLYFFVRRFLFPKIKDKIRKINVVPDASQYEWFLSNERIKHLDKQLIQIQSSLNVLDFQQQ